MEKPGSYRALVDKGAPCAGFDSRSSRGMTPVTVRLLRGPSNKVRHIAEPGKTNSNRTQGMRLELLFAMPGGL